MFIRPKSLALAALLMVPATIGVMAQTVNPSAPAPVTPPPHGVGAWISGHPFIDFLIALAIVAVIAGAYFSSHRSRA
jgi:hypothetical protein